MNQSNPIRIYIVDDDASFRSSLNWAFSSLGYQVTTFPNAEEFISQLDIAWPAVLISDMRMPGKSGVQLQQELMNKAFEIPIIFISGETTVEESILGLKQGAIDFLQKPFEMETLLTVVNTLIEKQKVSLDKKNKSILREKKLAKLSPREHQVFLLVVRGFNNPKIAKNLNLSIETIKQYKQNIYGKLGIEDLAGLIQFMQD